MVFLHQFNELWHVNNKFAVQTIWKRSIRLKRWRRCIWNESICMSGSRSKLVFNDILFASLSHSACCACGSPHFLCCFSSLFFLSWHLLSQRHSSSLILSFNSISLCGCSLFFPGRPYHHYFITWRDSIHPTLTEINLRKYWCWNACDDFLVLLSLPLPFYPSLPLCPGIFICFFLR